MNKKKIYISGPITGKPNYKADFRRAEVLIIASNNEPINPANVQLEAGATWADFMRHDLKLLLECDGVYMLRGWEQSQGARLEYQVARELGLKVYDESEQEGN